MMQWPIHYGCKSILLYKESNKLEMSNVMDPGILQVSIQLTLQHKQIRQSNMIGTICQMKVKAQVVLTSLRSTKPATLPPPAQRPSNTLSTLLFTLHLVFPSISRAWNVSHQTSRVQTWTSRQLGINSKVEEALAIRSKLDLNIGQRAISGYWHVTWCVGDNTPEGGANTYTTVMNCIHKVTVHVDEP